MIKEWYVLSSHDSVKRLEQQFATVSASRRERGEDAVEYFLPTCVEQASPFGKPKLRRKKLISSYVFVRDSLDGILDIKGMISSLWLLPHPDNRHDVRRYMTISDREMELFKAVAGAYANELPCYPLEMVDLEEGDRVEIVGGDFDGMCGTLQCSQGRNGGKVMMAIGNLFIVATPTIAPQYIRILQFGKGNRHPYRQFEAHLPRALQALRHACDAGLTADDVALMSVFTGRFDALKPATVNMASQHASLMLMSYAALGEGEKVELWQERCEGLLPQIKSDTQRAWQLAFMFAATGDPALRCQAESITSTWTLNAGDRKRALIIDTLESFSQLYSQDYAHQV